MERQPTAVAQCGVMRLVCSKSGSHEIDMVVSGTERLVGLSASMIGADVVSPGEIEQLLLPMRKSALGGDAA